MPAMFAIGDKVIGNPTCATFAAFGSFAHAAARRLRRPDARAAAGAGGARRWPAACSSASARWPRRPCGSRPSRWRSSASRVIFAGVVSSVLAGATTSLLLAFILPVTLAGPGVVDARSARRLGHGRRARRCVAIALLWPAPTRGPLRAAGDRRLPGARGAAARRRSRTCSSGDDEPLARERDHAVEQADAGRRGAAPRVPRDALPPDRPEHRRRGRSVRLVDELSWLERDRRSGRRRRSGAPVSRAACAVKVAAAAVLERGAELLDDAGGECSRAARGAGRARRRAARDGAERDQRAAGRRAGTAASARRGDASRRERVHHLARPELPRAGARLRRLAASRATST